MSSKREPRLYYKTKQLFGDESCITVEMTSTNTNEALTSRFRPRLLSCAPGVDTVTSERFIPTRPSRNRRYGHAHCESFEQPQLRQIPYHPHSTSFKDMAPLTDQCQTKSLQLSPVARVAELNEDLSRVSTQRAKRRTAHFEKALAIRSVLITGNKSSKLNATWVPPMTQLFRICYTSARSPGVQTPK